MYNKQQVFIGVVIILVGMAFLVGNIFDVDVGSLCCPVALIATGVLLLMRPHLLDPDTPGRLKPLGDVRRRGAWQVADEEYQRDAQPDIAIHAQPALAGQELPQLARRGRNPDDERQ